MRIENQPSGDQWDTLTDLGGALRCKFNICVAYASCEYANMLITSMSPDIRRLSGWIPIWGSEIVFLRYERDDRPCIIHDIPELP